MDDARRRTKTYCNSSFERFVWPKSNVSKTNLVNYFWNDGKLSNMRSECIKHSSWKQQIYLKYLAMQFNLNGEKSNTKTCMLQHVIKHFGNILYLIKDHSLNIEPVLCFYVFVHGYSIFLTFVYIGFSRNASSAP